MLNGLVYYGQSNGQLIRRAFRGGAYGTAVAVSGADRVVADADWHDQIQSITSMFFDRGRIYYTLAGQSELYFRYFTQQSDVVGALQFTSARNSAFAQVKSGFYAGGKYCYSVAMDGNLRCLAFAYGGVSGSPRVVSGPGVDRRDWRSGAMFAFQV
jgi:uncharacterized membrane protein